MSSLYYNEGDLILAMYMYTSTGSKDNIKFYKKDHILSLEKPRHACIIILNNDTYIHVYIGIQCRDLHNEKKITYKQLQKHVFWNSLQILHRKPSFYHTMHLFLGFI